MIEHIDKDYNDDDGNGAVGDGSSDGNSHFYHSLLPAYENEDKSLKLMRKGKDWTIMITRTTHIMFTCVYEDPKKRGLLTLYLTPFPEGLNVQPHVA